MVAVSKDREFKEKDARCFGKMSPEMRAYQVVTEANIADTIFTYVKHQLMTLTEEQLTKTLIRMSCPGGDHDYVNIVIDFSSWCTHFRAELRQNYDSVPLNNLNTEEPSTSSAGDQPLPSSLHLDSNTESSYPIVLPLRHDSVLMSSPTPPVANAATMSDTDESDTEEQEWKKQHKSTQPTFTITLSVVLARGLISNYSARKRSLDRQPQYSAKRPKLSTNRQKEVGVVDEIRLSNVGYSSA
ncbi:unnamed protein product [Parnassius apollo]|uniref:(apollo) hypothetical protein n=1 Tax=Parnassius apollo TaxID=110799 RepID=A0A8S3WEC8_PARAO|nr:unnamed protein product [Parnassius apollo]